jgi:hypothetical protein
MGKFADGFRSFKKGLDKKLLLDYWLAVKEHGWETLWGAGIVGVPFGLLTIYYAPSRAFLGWLFVWIVLVAGYNAWRTDHVRLIPKLKIVETRFQWTPTTNELGIATDERTFIQLMPKCLTESPVYECVGYLQHVDKLTENGQWEETVLDRNLILHWGENKVELHPQSEKPLNVFFIQHSNRRIIPCLKPDADIPWPKFDSIFARNPTGTTAFRFYIQITCSDRVNGNFVSIPSVPVRLDVQFDINRLRPSLDLVELTS